MNFMLVTLYKLTINNVLKTLATYSVLNIISEAKMTQK